MAKTNEQIAEEAKQAELEAQNKAAVETVEQKKEQAAQLQKDAETIQKESVVPVTTTVAQIDAVSDKTIEEATEQTTANTLELGTVATMTSWTVDEHGRHTHPNDVKFEVTNPKDTGMPKGITVVSRETAEHFKSLGIGKIVK